jgi:chromosome segregation ATPase
MVNGLEAIVQELSNTKNEQFELLQSRQAEVESSRAELETLRNRTKELEFQLREADERCAMLEEGAAVSSRPAEANDRGRSLLGVGLPDGGNLSRSPSRSGSYSQTSAGEVQRLLAEAESRSEAKLSDLRFKIRSLEKERNEAEEEWAVKLQERVHELEKLRRVIAEKEGEYAESLRKRDEKDARIAEGNEARKVLEKEIKGLKAKIEEMKEDVEVAADGEVRPVTSSARPLQCGWNFAERCGTLLTLH